MISDCRTMLISETSVEQCAGSIVETLPLFLRLIRAELRRHPRLNLSLPQLRALVYLRDQPGASASGMAEYLGVTRATASTTIERLVQRELITRTDDPQERRRVVLNLTEAGHRQLEQASTIAQERVAEALAGLSPSRLRRINEGLLLLQSVLHTRAGITR